MRHKSLNRLLGGAAAVGLMTAVAAQGDPASAQQRPNIVMLMTDDTGWNDFGAYSGGGAALGHPTPNVDQIAKEGAVFTNWYGQAKQNVSQFQQSHPDAKQNASQVEQNRTAQENQLQSNRTDEANQLQANRTNEANQLQANRYNEVGQLQNNRVNNWNNYNGDWGGYYSGLAGFGAGLAVGATIAALPAAAAAISVAGNPYYYANGVYYAPQGGQYAVVPPPQGAVVPTPPPSCSTVYVGSSDRARLRRRILRACRERLQSQPAADRIDRHDAAKRRSRSEHQRHNLFVFGGAYYRPFYSGSSVIYEVVAKPA
jgi:hypothetical protein